MFDDFNGQERQTEGLFEVASRTNVTTEKNWLVLIYEPTIPNIGEKKNA